MPAPCCARLRHVVNNRDVICNTTRNDSKDVAPARKRSRLRCPVHLKTAVQSVVRAPLNFGVESTGSVNSFVTGATFVHGRWRSPKWA